MTDDEKAIRDLIATWHRATVEGDVARVLTLVSEDVAFLVAGQPPGRGQEPYVAVCGLSLPRPQARESCCSG